MTTLTTIGLEGVDCPGKVGLISPTNFTFRGAIAARERIHKPRVGGSIPPAAIDILDFLTTVSDNRLRRITLNLTKRADGRVCKKIDGQYFIWPDEDTARAEILEIARRREHGSDDMTVPATPQDPPLRVIANLFRADRKPRVAPGTWDDYETSIDQFLAVVGKNRFAGALTPDDFAAARTKWGKTLGPWKLDNRIQSVRTMFKWASTVGRLIDREPWYGDAFRKTSKADKRRVNRERISERGERVFSPGELKKILRIARGQIRAFVLLGLNGGMYAKDIADLMPADLKREGGHWVIDNDRIKTGVRRKTVLWPETVRALKSCRRGGDRLFVTLHGNPWVNGETNSIALLFNRLLTVAKIKRDGVGFGALKHTHTSATGSHPDRAACRVTRGHEIEGIESHYDIPNIQRLKSVTDLARRRLLTNAVRQAASRPASSARRASAA